MYPTKLNELIESFKHLPGVGNKSAERYALKVLNFDEEELEMFINSLKGIKEIHSCPICGNITDDEICDICKDKNRDTSTILVVQEVKDMIAIENTNEYNGLYHILGGAIATNKGIMPDDLNIDSLFSRLDGVKEVIIATNPTVEGETTALYLSKLLSKFNIETSRIANGIPMGGHLDYADDLTLIKALEGRKKY